jgi:hypothetical protein
MPRRSFVLSLAVLAACSDRSPAPESRSAASRAALDEAIGARPLLGWNSFDVLSTSRAGYGQTWLNESHVKGASDAMQQKLQSAGYEYINIDSGWSANLQWTSSSHDGYGVPMPDPERFPGGIDGMAAYVHAKGQKLGLYDVVGLEVGVYNSNVPIEGTTCHTQDIARQPLAWVNNGWYAQYEIDWSNPCAQAFYNSRANRYASWGVDLLKVDGTTADNGPDIQAWQAAVAQTGRPMWLTVSAWPVPISLGPGIRQSGQSVRIDTDIDCYCSTITTWTASVDQRWTDLPGWLAYLGPGHFPDLDSMPISNDTGSGVQDGLDDTERQTVMTFWSMASAPLWVGGDIYFMDATAQAILTNPEVIAVDQAAVLPAQIAGGNLQEWQKPLPDGSIAVAVYNLGSTPADIEVDFSALGFSGDARLRDLVSRADLGVFAGNWIASSVPAHGSRLLRVSSQPNDGIAGYTFCSSGYQNCALGSGMDVAWGALGSFVYRSDLSGTFYCDTGTFGSDPAWGSLKGCYVKPHGGGGPSSYSYCAGEGQTCKPGGVVDVAYGANGAFALQTGVEGGGGFGCNNGTFGDPAYGWTKACYTRPSGGGVAYEAEAATLSGAAVVASCSNCAGGEKVGYLGNGAGNAVTFPQIDVGWSGNHQLIVHGVSGDPRTFAVSVNGAAPIAVPVQSRDWSTPTTVTVTVPLNRGINTIGFTGTDSWAPDLDRIVVW